MSSRRTAPSESDEPTLTIRGPSLVALDYVDLSGSISCVSLLASSGSEASAVLQKAWGSNLLWYYRLHLSTDTETKSRKIPWEPEELAGVLQAAQLASDIERWKRDLARLQKVVITGDWNPFRGDRRKEISDLAATSSELAALEAVYEQHVASLASKGIRVPVGTFDDIAKTIKAVETAASTLKEIYGLAGKLSSMVSMPYVSRVPAAEFVSRLPRNEAIFSQLNLLSEE